MYEAVYSSLAVKQLKKLEAEMQDCVIKAIERIRIRPSSFVRKLVGSPYYRLRVRDYRVIMDIIENKLLIFVIEIGHRKKIYK